MIFSREPESDLIEDCQRDKKGTWREPYCWQPSSVLSGSILLQPCCVGEVTGSIQERRRWSYEYVQFI